MPSASFGIKLFDILVTDLPVSSQDTLGLEISQIQIPGIVSLYEEHNVRSEAGYTLFEWYNLSGYDRALEVALGRIKSAIEYQKVKQQERQAKSKSKG